MYYNYEYSPLHSLSAENPPVSEEEDYFPTEYWQRTPRYKAFLRRAYDLLRTPCVHVLLRRSTCRLLSLRMLRAVLICIGSLVGIFILVSILNGILFPSYANPPPHYHRLETSVLHSTALGRGNINSEKVFIAANIIQEDLIRGHWGTSVLQLVDLLGPENVFVSIFENDSTLGTRDALEILKAKLPCNYSVVTGAHVALDDFPKIITRTGEARVKRLAYLAELRNRLLWPLDPVGSHDLVIPINHTNVQFDRILFLNDVYMRPIDAIHLLFSTNLDAITNRADYDVACAVDFVQSVMFYDSFVVRDVEGYEIGLMFFPWFAPKGRAESRNDVLGEKDAVRVRSCWGGMAAYEAREFQRRTVEEDFGRQWNQSYTGASIKPLRFRYSPEIFWEASECCLINADLADRRPERRDKIFLNPYIRVAYDSRSWSWLPFIRRIERVFAILQHVVSSIAYPEYNPRQNEQAGTVVTTERWVYEDEHYNGERVDRSDVYIQNGMTLPGAWAAKEASALPGGFCAQRRLFVMKKNLSEANSGYSGRNWEKILVP